MNTPSPQPAIDRRANCFTDALRQLRTMMGTLFVFSLATNLLMLCMPVYSLQVFDRVMSSGSMSTLWWLSVITVAMLVALSLIQLARDFVTNRAGDWLQKKLSPQVLETSLELAASNSVSPASHSALRDVQMLKQFLSGPALSALLDLPWSPIFIIVLFMIHWVLGVISLLGAIVLGAFGYINEMLVHKGVNSQMETQSKSQLQMDLVMRNAEVVSAMGMGPNVVGHWSQSMDESLALHKASADSGKMLAATSKCVRLLLQVMVTGVGAWLALNHEITAGAIIACSILVGRALAPFENAIATWNQILESRKSMQRLRELFGANPKALTSVELPTPKGDIDVQNVFYVPKGQQKPTLRGISFSLQAGDLVGVIGASAAGKTTLAKVMMGVWTPTSGHVRLDGASLPQWNREQFGRHAGYLPQDVELFDGTVRDNIARFRTDATDAQVVEAAQFANVHELILELPQGYNTSIGPGGLLLSAGQRQRVGLARAFFGMPCFVVLDEPNANLDSIGDEALRVTLSNAKARKMTVVIISHRPSILNIVDRIAVMNLGALEAFDKADVIRSRYQRNPNVME